MTRPGFHSTGGAVSRRLALTAAVAAASAVGLAACSGGPTATRTSSATARGTFGPVTLYRPAADRPAPGALYARSVQLRTAPATGGRRPLLATFEQYVDHDPVFPIHRSDDGGRTWRQRGSVRDTQNGWGMRYQPFLYELPAAFGGFPAGTVLCAGNSIPDDLSKTKIDVYASRDHGDTWAFVSSVARGGRALPNNGLTPIWEPFLLLHAGRLICYYSDQRDPKHGQKLVHQTTTDLRTWGAVVDDVASDSYDDRPGMTTVAALPDGRWILTHEAGGDGDGEAFFAVHYRIAGDPERFGTERSVVLRDTTGHVPESSPTVLWTPGGGAHGTIVVSAGSDRDLFINRQLGAEKAWTRLRSVVPAGYTRFLTRLDDGLALTISGGRIGIKGHNPVQAGVDRIA